jgi:hypothetical protein
VLVSTNVPETDYPAYAAGTTYAQSTTVAPVRVIDDHLIYESLQAANIGHAPATSPTWWFKVGATNARKMIDGKVMTQTTNANEIVMVLAPGRICHGAALLNVDADSATITVTDAVDGVVYLNTLSSAKSNSGSKFFNWCFKRIRRKTVFAWTDLPSYYNATITITVSKPGGIAKCGMAIVGPVEELGFAEYGLSTGIKDYSTNLFDAFGELTSVERAWGKKMSCTVKVANELIDDIQLILAGYRAKSIVCIASKQYESTILYCRYADFKTVIPNKVFSDCSLTLDGLI